MYFKDFYLNSDFNAKGAILLCRRHNNSLWGTLWGAMKSTKTVKLRALEPEDVDAVYRWENDPAVWQFGVSHQPFSRDMLQRYLLEASDLDIYAARQLRLMAEDGGGRAVGCVDLYDFDPFHRRAGVGLIVDQAVRNQGYGAAILQQMADFAATHLNLHQLYCDIAEDNRFSIKLFEKAGYRRCSAREDWLQSNGKWIKAFGYQLIIEN